MAARQDGGRSGKSGSLFARDGTPPAKSLIFVLGGCNKRCWKAVDLNLPPISSLFKPDHPLACQEARKAKNGPRGKRSQGRPPAPRATKPAQDASRGSGLARAENPGSVSLLASKQETVKLACGHRWKIASQVKTNHGIITNNTLLERQMAGLNSIKFSGDLLNGHAPHPRKGRKAVFCV